MYIEDKNFILDCKSLLIQHREETLNDLSYLNQNLKEDQKEDSAGLAFSLQEENYKLSRGRDLSLRLKKIDEALARIESGDYGYCHLTEEPIEKARLQAIPWTDLSLAGAEILEQQTRKH